MKKPATPRQQAARKRNFAIYTFMSFLSRIKALLARKAWWKKFWTDTIPDYIAIAILSIFVGALLVMSFSLAHELAHKYTMPKNPTIIYQGPEDVVTMSNKFVPLVGKP